MAHDSAAPLASPAAALSIAPMMGWTDVQYRRLARLLTAKTKLYTEMVSTTEVMQSGWHGARRLLGISDPNAGPVALQLGGSDPEQLAAAVDIIRGAHGLSHLAEINLNCGCPSPRVANDSFSGFGARLMHDPERVRRCVDALARAAPSVPITVKCRLGTDQAFGMEKLQAFIHQVSAGGAVRHVAIHARECLLEGLSPAENRAVPPLRVRWAHQLQADFPGVTFAVNGGIRSLEMAQRHLDPLHESFGTYAGLKEWEAPRRGHLKGLSAKRCGTAKSCGVGDEEEEEEGGGGGQDPPDAWRGGLQGSGEPGDSVWGDLPPVFEVMVGREAFTRPWFLRHADSTLFHTRDPRHSREEILEHYLEQTDTARGNEDQWGEEEELGYEVLQPLLTLFAGERGGKKWRHQIQEGWKAASELRRQPGDGADLVRRVVSRALEEVPSDVLDAR